jgi:hypothetical protein
MNIALFALALIIFLIAYMLFRTSRLSKFPQPVAPVDKPDIDQKIVSTHLAELIRFRSISTESSVGFDPQPFLDIHRWIDNTYPLLTKNLEKTCINQYSLLYVWEGIQPETNAGIVQRPSGRRSGGGEHPARMES